MVICGWVTIGGYVLIVVYCVHVMLVAYWRLYNVGVYVWLYVGGCMLVAPCCWPHMMAVYGWVYVGGYSVVVVYVWLYGVGCNLCGPYGWFRGVGCILLVLCWWVCIV